MSVDEPPEPAFSRDGCMFLAQFLVTGVLFAIVGVKLVGEDEWEAAVALFVLSSLCLAFVASVIVIRSRRVQNSQEQNCQ